jgi:2-oxoglutarate ferredoxin oxidoreductase subunit alpha
MSQHTLDAVKGAGLSKKEALRCKNMWALGLSFWLFERRRKSTVDWLEQKFASRPELSAANIAALNAGHAFGETSEMTGILGAFTVRPAEVAPGLYRNVNGTEAMSWGLVAGAALAELPLVFCSYPITPASGILHTLAGLKDYGVITFQAEDEIAAVCAAIGASFAGAMGVTSSSGPGMSLKTEGFDLAISTELPLVVINTQRAGPSRTALGGHQHPTRRPLDRDADQDRAGGPAAGGLRPPRRLRAGGPGGPIAGRLLRGGDRRHAVGHQIHDPGDPVER